MASRLCLIFVSVSNQAQGVLRAQARGKDALRDVLKLHLLTNSLASSLSQLLSSAKHGTSNNHHLAAVAIIEAMLALTSEDVSSDVGDITQSNGSKLVVLANGQGEGTLQLRLLSVQKQVLGVETSANDAGRVAQLDARVAFGAQDDVLNVNELAQTGLLVPLGVVAAGSRDEQHVLDAGLLGGLAQLDGDVDLVLVGGRDHADGVTADLLEGLDHLALAARVVRDDLGSERLELLALGVGRVESQAGDAVDLLGELALLEE